ncbi:MAG: hypothetical protein ACI9F1_002568, partial [Colwellia sp.]
LSSAFTHIGRPLINTATTAIPYAFKRFNSLRSVLL